MLRIVPFYAGLLALFYCFLAVRVIRMRRTEHIAIGDGGNARLRRAIRVHSNFAEYVPLALLLFAFLELQRTAPLLVHGLCLALVLGRIAHACGVSREKENYHWREIGMFLTFGPIIVAATRLVGALILF